MVRPSSSPPLIGITLDSEPAGGWSNYPWYAVRENYCAAVLEVGGLPVLLPHEPGEAEAYLKRIDGLLITGGAFDLDPVLFGANTRHETVRTKDRRTQFEAAITRAALALDLPVLGICGGQQLLNVVLGGTLIQHIPDEVENALPHEQPNPRHEAGHTVALSNGSLLRTICKSAELPVNSAHHQAVKQVGPGVAVSAVAPDGVIEGIEAPDFRFCLGVQWHPEYAVSPGDTAVFRAFVSAAAWGLRWMAEIEKGERIAKVIARAGLCSRRDAETWIRAGRVSVDGKQLTSPAAVVTGASRIAVDGEPLPAAAPPRLFLYHKPRGEITTTRDPQGRTTVFDHLPAGLPRLQAVGRLDINSEGLLLLTSDGGLKRQLELPSSGWLRRYRVRAMGHVRAERLAALAKGITVEGVDYGPVEAALDRQSGANAWLTFALREGKNREVRKICAHLGLSVNRLIRVAYGPFSLGKLPKRAVEEVVPGRLRQALGLEDKEKKKQGKGFAKAKPKPNRPGSRRGFKHQRAAAEKGENEEKRPRRSPKAEATKKKERSAKKAASGKVGGKRTAAKKSAARPNIKKPAPKKGSARKAAKHSSATKSGSKHAHRRRPS